MSCIVKVAGKYLLWSSIVDAPITYGMTRAELVEYVGEESGRLGLSGLDKRIERADTTGTSSMHKSSAAQVMWLNRAGLKESRLTLAQIVDTYITRGGEGELPVGYIDPEDNDAFDWTMAKFLGEES